MYDTFDASQTLTWGLPVKQLLKSIQDRLFGVEDTVCLERARLVTEAYRKHEGEPMPLLRARALRHILDNMTLDLSWNPVFAGNASSAPRAWMIAPEYGIGVDLQVRIEHDDLAGILDGRIPSDIAEFWRERSFGHTPGGWAGVGHMAPDHERIVATGLNGIIAEIDAQDGGTPEQQVYRQAMRESCEAVVAWAGRYAVAADRLAAQETELRTDCLRRVASACRHVPAEPARNLFEGLQCILLVHLAMVLEGQGMSLSIGLPDRVLAQFADEASADPDAAADLVAAFLLGLSANPCQGRGSKTQALTVGGADETGRDRCNAITEAFLEAYARVPVADPHLFVRWHEALNPVVCGKAMDMLSAGRSMPLLVNDHQVAPALEAHGVAPEDSWDYAIMGCNELGVPGRLFHSATSVGIGYDDLDILDVVLRRTPDEFAGTEDAITAWAAEVEARTDQGIVRRREFFERLAAQVPMPFSTATMRGSAKRGADQAVSMQYNVPGLFVRGTSNAINVLSMLEEVVFQRRDATIAGLLASADSDGEKLCAALANAPAWGDDDARADHWASALCRARNEAHARVARRNGLPGFMTCHVVRSLHHVDGRRMGPTLDGRRAGEPVGDSIGAVLGTASNGPTALLRSVLSLDARRDFPGIYNLNLTLPLGRIDAKGLGALVGTFMREAGQELQVNALDPAVLRDARTHPESHRDLVVRVAGLSARFVELSDLEQRELIARAEQAAG